MLLFGKQKESATRLIPSLVVIRPPQPIPVSLEAEMKEEERKAYAKLCKEIGFRPAALIKDEVIAFLQEHQEGVYDYQHVKEYLDQQFGKKKEPTGNYQTWGWCPLRELDRGKSGFPSFGSNPDRAFDEDNGGVTFGRTYHSAIPFPVLDLVKKLSVAVPETYFFVSDVVRSEDRKGDPFLAVTTPGLEEMIVIQEWDEPSFRK